MIAGIVVIRAWAALVFFAGRFCAVQNLDDAGAPEGRGDGVEGNQ